MNKYLLTIISVILIASMASSCDKDGKHEVRVKNESNTTLTDFHIFNNNYGTINPGETTDYKEVASGSMGTNATGTVTYDFSDKGKHKYTYYHPSGELRED